MSNPLEALRQPISSELAEYSQLFDETVRSRDLTVDNALAHVRGRKGKMMRPILVLLTAKATGQVTRATHLAATSLELLHTASRVHDDVVDESGERRGQKSVNAMFDNKIAVLLGDYLLSQCLLCSAQTQDLRIVEHISRLGGELSEGEIHQLANTEREEINEEDYYRVIDHKTAALFRACTLLGCYSAGASEEWTKRMKSFGETVGLCFQIRDDIFDYYDDSEIGKPVGNDMKEGKLTLPVIHALLSTGDEAMRQLALKVRALQATPEEIAELVGFTKRNGGIAYAEQTMARLVGEARALLAPLPDASLRQALEQYLDFVVARRN